MHPALRKKLEELVERSRELERLLSDPAVLSKPGLLKVYTREHGSLAKVVERVKELDEVERRRNDAGALVADGADAEMAALAREELAALDARRDVLLDELSALLVADPDDDRDAAIVEVRAGVGGEEACLFVGDMFDMYKRFSERRGWKVEVMDTSPSDLGGFKEIVFSVSGEGVYRALRYESGTHRVQRVPETESKGRIHTSAATVAVLPEVEDLEVDVKTDDVRMDFFRASGPGGQNVNKTSSAVRLTHIPTGIVVQCQDESSQHKNRARAFRVLRSRIYEHFLAQKTAARSNMRRSQIGSGDRSEKIRTYNFPQNRVTDHRIKLDLHNLPGFLEGNLDEMVEALGKSDREERLKNLQ